MNNSRKLIFLNAIFLLWTGLAHASYTENLFLCDLGIMNSNTSNQLGVDSIQYTQFGKTMSLSALSTSLFTSQLEAAKNFNGAYDRWDASIGMTDIFVNLDSDFYGSRYYLEYCYTWNRAVPSDNLNYEIKFSASLPIELPSTRVSVDTKCSMLGSKGDVVSNEYLQSFKATNTLSTDVVSMRCTVRLNFVEDSFTKSRPHDGSAFQLDPNVSIEVSP